MENELGKSENISRFCKNDIRKKCNYLINNDQKMFNVLDLINEKITRFNLTPMLEILSHLSLLSAQVKMKIVESGLALKITDLMEVNFDPENQQNFKMIQKLNKDLVSFVLCIKNISEINFHEKSSRFKLSFWDIITKLFFITNSKLRDITTLETVKATYIGTSF